MADNNRSLKKTKQKRDMNRVLTTYIFLAATLLISGVATAQVQVGGRVFGGGNLAPVGGNTEVMIKQAGATVAGDVYGGGALADVGTDANNTTTVTILAGTFGGDIYGGGLGRKDDPNTSGINEAVAAAVNGVVTVNIGTGTVNPDTHFATSVLGSATLIGRSVFGCNNANGTPKDNVTVNIFKTAHIDTNNADHQGNDSTFAINQVFGGGNQAHYEPITSDKKAIVHIYTCDNTIDTLYGGGNAANVGTEDSDPNQTGNQTIEAHTDVIIDGGRIGWVFGGGNGAGASNPGAHIFGNTSVTFRAGDVEYFFGGSNEKGRITGQKTISIRNDNQDCVENHDNHITELYGGNNKADATGDISLTIPCTNTPCKIDYLFGGSRNADIGTAEAPANIVLTIAGGLYDYVFGGNNQGGTIYGNVTLNLFGGTINEAAFGGNNAGGNIKGKITVNLLEQSCPLTVHNIYGGGQLAAYTPTPLGAYPEVNLIHGTVSKKTDGTGGNVFGGGLGSTAVVASSPVVNVGYDNVSMASLIPTLLPENATLQTANVVVQGDVYGGGEEAAVNGSVIVNVQQVSVEGLNASTTVGGDVYGGGALADVNVITNGSGEPIYNDGTTTSVTLLGGTVGNIYGGGLGRQANQEQSITAVEAKVYGPVQVTVTAGKVTGAVYGCNNENGAPQNTVKVDIYGTDDPAQGQTYALSKVFGGGNMAAYGGTPDVTIHNCDNKIGEVYGGGNKASVVNTNVKVYGGNTIGKVFAGGNGEGVDPSHVMVSGNAIAHIYGGTIGQVFGGNNASGTISGNASALYINKQPEQENGNACTMKIGEVYGGGNLAAGNASAITVGCTGTLVPLGENQHYGTDQEGIGTVYGGANAANVGNNITLNINSGIVENVFGGNNASGSISGTITVNIEKDESNTATCPDDWYVGNVYGGGNHAAYSGTPNVNIKAGTVSGNVFGGGNDITTANEGVGGSNVDMTGGTVLGGIYGGCNLNGYVMGNSQVIVKGGTVGSQTLLTGGTTADIFGGGLGENTRVNGNVTVTITRASGDDAPAAPIIYGDVYGGSALGNVNDAATDKTTVNILDGTLKTEKTSETLSNGQIVYYFTGGNVYGGGLGDNDNAALVNGVVTVNVGTFTVVYASNPGEENDTTFFGYATIEGNVYGCNNANGSPQDNVTVNIFGTAHTDDNIVSNVPEGDDIENQIYYAIANVFGGGNEADYAPENGATNTTKKARVNIKGCDNTIWRTFGGGNAAATPSVKTDIQGGRFYQVFGGGNGERGSDHAANINGRLDLYIHGGNVGQFFGASNQYGSITPGPINVVVDDNSPCGGNLIVDEFFCGGNFAPITGDLTTTMTCSEGMTVKNLYGGCNQANITGNVVLNVEGGTFVNVYGGSKGIAGTPADITGNVTLNLYGGTIENAFGGSNVNGNIQGIIKVNVIDKEDPDCPLIVTNIYGGSNVASYNPNAVSSGVQPVSPIINVVHAKNGIGGNVYGGSKGKEGVTTTVNAHPLVNIGYDATTMNNSNNVYIQTYVADHPSLIAEPRAIVAGSVFGGGDAAQVQGNTEIYLRNRAKVFGNVYGGGNMGEVTGNTKVIVNGANQ